MKSFQERKKVPSSGRKKSGKNMSPEKSITKLVAKGRAKQAKLFVIVKDFTHGLIGERLQKPVEKAVRLEELKSLAKYKLKYEELPWKK